MDPDLIDYLTCKTDATLDVGAGIANPQAALVYWQLPLERRGRLPHDLLVGKPLHAAARVYLVNCVLLLRALGSDNHDAFRRLQPFFPTSVEKAYAEGRELYGKLHVDDLRTMEGTFQSLITSQEDKPANAVLANSTLRTLGLLRDACVRSDFLNHQLYKVGKALTEEKKAELLNDAHSSQRKAPPSIAECALIAIYGNVNPSLLWIQYNHYRFVFNAAVHAGRICRGMPTQLDGMAIYTLLRILLDENSERDRHRASMAAIRAAVSARKSIKPFAAELENHLIRMNLIPHPGWRFGSAMQAFNVLCRENAVRLRVGGPAKGVV